MSAPGPAGGTTYFDLCPGAGELAAFVAARLDEYARQAARAAGEGADYVKGVSYRVGFKTREYTPDGLLHHVAGWRRIMHDVGENYRGDWGELPPVLLHFARAHSSHPDFKGEWRGAERPEGPRLLLS